MPHSATAEGLQEVLLTIIITHSFLEFKNPILIVFPSEMFDLNLCSLGQDSLTVTSIVALCPKYGQN